MSAHDLQNLVDGLHEKYRGLSEGEVATYIPELARANPHASGSA